MPSGFHFFLGAFSSPPLCVSCSPSLLFYKAMQSPIITFIKMPYNKQSPSPGCEVLDSMDAVFVTLSTVTAKVC